MTLTDSMPLNWAQWKSRAAAPSSNLTHEEYAEIHHYHFAGLFERAVEVINTAAGLLVIAAILLGGINLVIVAFNATLDKEYLMLNPLHSGHNRVATVTAIRLMLGELTALALAILVAADVVDTVIKPTHAFDLDVVIKMGFITVLRTGLAYFLAKEIKEQEEVHKTIVRSKSSLGFSHMSGAPSFSRGSSQKPSPPGSDFRVSPSPSMEHITSTADAFQSKKRE